MKIAIMQPYVFPYIGYFQLIKAVDTFVFYDDVNYIKGGWINRNNILVNSKSYMFTISLEKPSSYTLISETKINEMLLKKNVSKLIKTIEQSYKKAPFFETVFPLIRNFLLSYNNNSISSLAIDSVILISNYLKLETEFRISSKNYSSTKSLEKTQRIIEICRIEEAKYYINPIRGIKLYNEVDFFQNNLELYFIKSEPIYYKQFDNEFVDRLSILDVIMFNSIEATQLLLSKFKLI